MLTFEGKQNHQKSCVEVVLSGVPFHPKQLAHYKQQGQQISSLGPEREQTFLLTNHIYDTGKLDTFRTNMESFSQQCGMLDESQVDIASAKGIFGWAVVDRTNVPYIIREKKRYVSVRMVEMKLLSKYPSTYPDELKDKPPLMSQYITPAEAKLLNEINFEHCAGEFGNNKFNSKDLIVSLEDFEEFYNIVRKHFPDEVLKSYTKGIQQVSTDGGWVQVNNTVVPYVLRTGVKLVPLSVIRYAAGLLSDVKVLGIEPTEEECVYLNKSCESAGLDFKFAKSTKMIELKLVPNLSKTNVNVVELPKFDPFGSAEYQDLPEEERSVSMGASLPVNVPVIPPGGMAYISGPPSIGVPPGTQMPMHQQRGIINPRISFEGLTSGPGGQPPIGSGWMNPHVGVYPGYPVPTGSQIVPGQAPFRHMGPPTFTATQSSPAGTMHTGYIGPEGSLQSNQQNQHALQNLQHMTKMAEMQMGRQKRRKSSEGRACLKNNTSVSSNQTPPTYVLDSYRAQTRNKAHLSPPQHLSFQAQLSSRMPLGHMSPHTMMEGGPGINGMPQPGMMIHGIGPHSHGRANHTMMQRMIGPQHIWQQQMHRNNTEYQGAVRQFSPPDLTNNPKRGPSMRCQSLVNTANAEVDKLPHITGISCDTPATDSVISLQRDKSGPRERGRIKSTPTRRSPSMSVPTASTPPPQPPIKTVEFHNKTISCIIKNGEYYALVEAISRVYFQNCSLQEFQYALEKVLHVRITQLDRDEEEIYIKFYGLPTKSLKCTKCVHLKDFDECMPKLKYMFRDKEQACVAKQKDFPPSQAAGDSNNNAKYSEEEQKYAGAKSETFNVLRNFLGKRVSDGLIINPTASKVARGFASRLEDAVNRLKKKSNVQESTETPTLIEHATSQSPSMPKTRNTQDECTNSQEKDAITNKLLIENIKSNVLESSNIQERISPDDCNPPEQGCNDDACKADGGKNIKVYSGIKAEIAYTECTFNTTRPEACIVSSQSKETSEPSHHEEHKSESATVSSIGVLTEPTNTSLTIDCAKSGTVEKQTEVSDAPTTDSYSEWTEGIATGFATGASNELITANRNEGIDLPSEDEIPAAYREQRKKAQFCNTPFANNLLYNLKEPVPLRMMVGNDEEMQHVDQQFVYKQPGTLAAIIKKQFPHIFRDLAVVSNTVIPVNIELDRLENSSTPAEVVCRPESISVSKIDCLGLLCDDEEESLNFHNNEYRNIALEPLEAVGQTGDSLPEILCTPKQTPLLNSSSEPFIGSIMPELNEDSAISLALTNFNKTSEVGPSHKYSLSTTGDLVKATEHARVDKQMVSPVSTLGGFLADNSLKMPESTTLSFNKSVDDSFPEASVVQEEPPLIENSNEIFAGYSMNSCISPTMKAPMQKDYSDLTMEESSPTVTTGSLPTPLGKPAAAEIAFSNDSLDVLADLDLFQKEESNDIGGKLYTQISTTDNDVEHIETNLHENTGDNLMGWNTEKSRNTENISLNNEPGICTEEYQSAQEIDNETYSDKECLARSHTDSQINSKLTAIGLTKLNSNTKAERFIESKVAVNSDLPVSNSATYIQDLGYS